MPPGLHYDEAFNGMDVTTMLSKPIWQWPIFFNGNFGREPLFLYLLAGAQRLLGPGIVTLRLVAALVGALLTPALMWLAWEMGPSLGANRRRLAPWAGMAVLTLLWSQIYARFALRVELFALLEVLSFAALWRAWRTNVIRWWAIAGVIAGLSFYSYLPSRLLPFISVPLALLAIWRYREQLTQRRAGIAIVALTGILVALPLAVYFVRNPLAFSTRLSQVSVLGEGITAIWHNIWATIQMVIVAGDINPRDNLPGRPVFDLVMFVPFLLGVISLLRRLLRPAALFLLSWLVIMLVPTIFSNYAPSFQRAIGAMPALALIAALGLDRAVAWADKRWPRGLRWYQATGWAALAAGIVITWRAFATWSASPELFFARDVGFVKLAAELTNDDAPGPIYLSPRGEDLPTIRYLLLRDATPPELRGFDGHVCVCLPAEGAARFVFLTGEDLRGPQLLQTYLPDGYFQTLVTDPAGRPWATRLVQPAGGRVQFPEMIAAPTTLSDGVGLLGYWLSDTALHPGERLYVRLFWRADARPAADYTTFVHLLQQGADGAMRQVVGVDAPPGKGTCATTGWAPGEIIVDELQMVLPPDLSAGRYWLTIGMYRPATGERLQVPGHSDDQIVLASLTTR